MTIGYKTNLQNLLASERDAHSDLGGADLVRRKAAPKEIAAEQSLLMARKPPARRAK